MFPVCSDIYGFTYYVDSTLTAGARNISIYLSPTTSFFNGTVCVANTSLASSGTTPNRINCTNTIANARYVTIVKYTFTGSAYLHCSELQILRSGEDSGSGVAVAWLWHNCSMAVAWRWHGSRRHGGLR